jgi:hypothetical protein
MLVCVFFQILHGLTESARTFFAKVDPTKVPPDVVDQMNKLFRFLIFIKF